MKPTTFRTRFALVAIAMGILFPLVARFAAFPSHGDEPLSIHVAPLGDDGADGTAERPLATLAGARDQIRARRAESADRLRPVRIVLHEGEYLFSSTVTLTDRDSGSPGAEVAYAAAPSAKVRFVGGPSLLASGWKTFDTWKQADASSVDASSVEASWANHVRANPEFAQHVLRYDLRAAGIATTYVIHPRGFPQPVRPAPMELFFDGRPMTLARYPNDGFVHTGEVIDSGSIAATGEEPRRPVFRFDDERLTRWAAAPDVWLFGYWKWDWADEAIRVAEIDPKTRQITLAAPHRYGVHAGQPFYAENIVAELDRPGEYTIDRQAGVLYFWPPEPIESGECRLSGLAEPMIHFDGASHLRIEGITFEYSRGDAVRIDGGSDVTIADCAFRNHGNRAIVVDGGARHAVERCDIERTGEGGIDVNGGDRQTLARCDHRVSDCRIRDFSRRTATYRPAVRLAGVGIRVEHCEISDAPHAAILFSGNDHTIEWNDIHHVLNRTGDGGAVYCGRDWTIRGTVIRHNHFHDIVGIEKWESAVYIDDQASGITITENLFTDCHWGMLMGGGRDNRIEGNVFVDCDLALHFDARGLGWAARMLDTLKERLESVPYRAKPWSNRFPELLTLIEDDPMVPKGNVIRGNLLIRSGSIDQDMAKEVKAHGVVEGNLQFDNEPNNDELNNHDPNNDDPKENDTAAAALRRIPLDKIGPRRDG